MEKRRLTSVIDEVELEAERFIQKLKAYRLRASNPKEYMYQTKEGASLRRSALDLKQELTKITQSISY